MSEETTPPAPEATPAALAAPVVPAGPPPAGFWWGTGRRKRAVARVRLVPNGSGQVTVNKNRNLAEFFPREQDQIHVLAPMHLTGTVKGYDLHVNVNGGGIAGQAGATRMGIARALVKANGEFYQTLKDAGYLTRDSRQVERKKPGKKGARASFQFSKR